jgi:hypothetical protein
MHAQRRRVRKGRPRQPTPQTLPNDLYDYADDPTPSPALRPHIPDVEELCVTDDWPELVPVTEAEIQVFERWFGDVFDELFGPAKPQAGLPALSLSDKYKA